MHSPHWLRERRALGHDSSTDGETCIRVQTGIVQTALPALLRAESTAVG